MERALRERGAQLVAAAGADGGAARERERHVGAELGREGVQLLFGEAGAPERVARDEGGRGIRRPSAHAAGDRNVLVDLEVHAARHARLAGEKLRGLDREVGAVDRKPRRVDAAAERDAELVVGPRPNVLVEGHRLVGGGDVVVAVGLQRADAHEQVDLAGRTNVDCLVRRRDRHGSTLAHGSRASRVIRPTATSCACVP